EPDRRLGQPAVASAGRPLRAGKARGALRRQACHRPGAAAAALVGVPPDAAAHRVLAGRRLPPARPARLYARPCGAGGRLDDRAALPMSQTDRFAGRVAGDEAARLLRLATTASVATALLLIVVKLVAFVLTDSVSILSTLIDSLLDAAASLVNLVAVRRALVPADREHRFGHGKAEPL